MQKTVSLGVISILLLGSFMGLISFSPVADAATLYVGGAGGGNYTTIQDAINISSNGDTVYVYAGTYYENLVVNKSLTIVGEDMDTTMIDGGGDHTIQVTSNWSNISGLNITGGISGIHLMGVHNNTIHDNWIAGNEYGIKISNSSEHNTIFNNKISTNDHGIYSTSSGNNTIYGNYFMNNLVQAYDDLDYNKWNLEYPDGGNTWDDPATSIIINTTSGIMVFGLYPERAPMTVQNFVRYVEDGFFEDLIFHRVINGFMIQGGGYNADLAQKIPTYPPIVHEGSIAGTSNLRGTIAMARTNDPNSATSQFYINHVDNTFLDWSDTNDGYCVFGEMVYGFDVLDAIASVATHSEGGHNDVPVADIVILSVTVNTMERIDNMWGPGQDLLGSDGICDVPYPIQGDANQDAYPLMGTPFVDDDPPIISMGTDIWTNQNTLVSLNGSGSIDNVGIVNYTWGIEYNGQNVLSYGSITDFLFEIPGEYSVGLNITDLAGNWADASIIVHVNDTTAPVANITGTATVEFGDDVALTANLSTDNVGVVNYTWTYQNNTLWGVNTTYLSQTLGVHNVTLNITDAAGNWNTTVFTIAIVDTTPPSVDAGIDAQIDTYQEYTFDDGFWDDLQGIDYWVWSFEYEGEGIASNELWPSHQFDMPGIYIVTLSVVDSSGNTANDTLVLTVVPTKDTATVEGTLLDLNGNPVAGALVTITHPFAPPVTTVTDENGDFSVEVIVGNFTWTVTKDNLTINGTGAAWDDQTFEIPTEAAVFPTTGEIDEPEPTSYSLAILILILLALLGGGILAAKRMQKPKPEQEYSQTDEDRLGDDPPQGSYQQDEPPYGE